MQFYRTIEERRYWQTFFNIQVGSTIASFVPDRQMKKFNIGQTFGDVSTWLDTNHTVEFILRHLIDRSILQNSHLTSLLSHQYLYMLLVSGKLLLKRYFMAGYGSKDNREVLDLQVKFKKRLVFRWHCTRKKRWIKRGRHLRTVKYQHFFVALKRPLQFFNNAAMSDRIHWPFRSKIISFRHDQYYWFSNLYTLYRIVPILLPLVQHQVQFIWVNVMGYEEMRGDVNSVYKPRIGQYKISGERLQTAFNAASVGHGYILRWTPKSVRYLSFSREDFQIKAWGDTKDISNSYIPHNALGGLIYFGSSEYSRGSSRDLKNFLSLVIRVGLPDGEIETRSSDFYFALYDNEDALTIAFYSSFLASFWQAIALIRCNTLSYNTIKSFFNKILIFQYYNQKILYFDPQRDRLAETYYLLHSGLSYIAINFPIIYPFVSELENYIVRMGLYSSVLQQFLYFFRSKVVLDKDNMILRLKIIFLLCYRLSKKKELAGFNKVLLIRRILGILRLNKYWVNVHYFGHVYFMNQSSMGSIGKNENNDVLSTKLVQFSDYYGSRGVQFVFATTYVIHYYEKNLLLALRLIRKKWDEYRYRFGNIRLYYALLSREQRISVSLQASTLQIWQRFFDLFNSYSKREFIINSWRGLVSFHFRLQNYSIFTKLLQPSKKWEQVGTINGVTQIWHNKEGLIDLIERNNRLKLQITFPYYLNEWCPVFFIEERDMRLPTIPSFYTLVVQYWPFCCSNVSAENIVDQERLKLFFKKAVQIPGSSLDILSSMPWATTWASYNFIRTFGKIFLFSPVLFSLSFKSSFFDKFVIAVLRLYISLAFLLRLRINGKYDECVDQFFWSGGLKTWLDFDSSQNLQGQKIGILRLRRRFSKSSRIKNGSNAFNEYVKKSYERSAGSKVIDSIAFKYQHWIKQKLHYLVGGGLKIISGNERNTATVSFLYTHLRWLTSKNYFPWVYRIRFYQFLSMFKTLRRFLVLFYRGSKWSGYTRLSNKKRFNETVISNSRRQRFSWFHIATHLNPLAYLVPLFWEPMLPYGKKFDKGYSILPDPIFKEAIILRRSKKNNLFLVSRFKRFGNNYRVGDFIRARIVKKVWSSISPFKGQLVIKRKKHVKKVWSSISPFKGQLVIKRKKHVKKVWSSISPFKGQLVIKRKKHVKKVWSREQRIAYLKAIKYAKKKFFVPFLYRTRFNFFFRLFRKIYKAFFLIKYLANPFIFLQGGVGVVRYFWRRRCTKDLKRIVQLRKNLKNVFFVKKKFLAYCSRRPLLKFRTLRLLEKKLFQSEFNIIRIRQLKSPIYLVLWRIFFHFSPAYSNKSLSPKQWRRLFFFFPISLLGELTFRVKGGVRKNITLILIKKKRKLLFHRGGKYGRNNFYKSKYENYTSWNKTTR